MWDSLGFFNGAYRAPIGVADVPTTTVARSSAGAERSTRRVACAIATRAIFVCSDCWLSPGGGEVCRAWQ